MTDMPLSAESIERMLEYTSSIVAAYLVENRIAAAEIPGMIRSVHGALAGLSAPAPAHNGAPRPSVPIKRSVTPDYIVCLEDGRKLKMLKRYLRTRFNLTPDAYRTKWNLPADYPMVAPNYAARRSAFAKTIGLGRRPAKPKASKRNRL